MGEEGALARAGVVGERGNEEPQIMGRRAKSPTLRINHFGRLASVRSSNIYQFSTHRRGIKEEKIEMAKRKHFRKLYEECIKKENG